jgi:hypothetical protein
MTHVSPEARLDALRASLAALTLAIAEEETQERERIAGVLPQHRQSATNLAHYLALRSSDVRDLQLELANFALSSFGRSEGHVRDTLNPLPLAWRRGKKEVAFASSRASLARCPSLRATCSCCNGREQTRLWEKQCSCSLIPSCCAG